MAHIDHHADPVHFPDHLLAHAGDAGILCLITSRRQQRLVVIAQLHKPTTKFMQHLNQPNIILNRAGVLKAEKNSRTPGFAGVLHITGPLAVKNQLGKPFKPTVPSLDV